MDRLAAAVADAPDIGPLVAQLRDANARLGELRERRAKATPSRTTVPKMPSLDQIRDLVGTLEADPSAAREMLTASFSTVRLVPTAHAYRVEMTVAEVCAGESCGGTLFGLPQTTFRALVPTRRGPVTVRVLAPRRAA